jgi:hydroxyethylthiazole kinase-like uncharacterized protein yjeF
MSGETRLPSWLEPLPDAGEQRALDGWAIDRLGIPGLELMERAARGLVSVLERHSPTGAAIAILCGGGNNGGDGLAAARLLREQGREVRVLLTVEPGTLTGDARTNLERLPGEPPVPFAPERLAGAGVILDAILGTGFAGAPREPARSAIEAIRTARGSDGVSVVACDVPSGVDASSGEVQGPAVEADLTVTFHAAKPGLWISPGKAHCGKVHVVDIGIPAQDNPEVVPAVGLITDRVLDTIPRRGASATKFSAGSVLVCGGSRGLTGAPTLASLAAARAGAGYVTVAVPASLVDVLAGKLIEVMQAPLPEDEGRLTPRALEVALQRVARVQALVLGPGLGREETSLGFARELAHRAKVALLLDADGLNAHAGEHLGALREREAPTVLTPHAGELARLLGCEAEEIGARRLTHARRAAAATGAIVVLKGDDTIIACPRGGVAVNPGGAPALATAGTGDVLSGVIAAHLAKGMDPFAAACAGVAVHAAAGRLAGQQIGPEGVIASDVVSLLPRVLADRAS